MRVSVVMFACKLSACSGSQQATLTNSWDMESHSDIRFKYVADTGSHRVQVFTVE